MNTYISPVDKFPTLKAVEAGKPFPEVNYTEELGVGPEHISELIRMANDQHLVRNEVSNEEFSAPLHAITALTQLHATEAIEPLVHLFNEGLPKDNDWLDSVLIDYYSKIGPVALPTLSAFLADPSNEMYARSNAATSIQGIAENYPASRPECIALITQQLENFAEMPEDLNAFIISDLIHLKAVEAAPVIEHAFDANKVDMSICGDWNDVQYDLGLKERPADQEPRSNLDFSSLLNPKTLAANQIEIIDQHKAPYSGSTFNAPSKSSKRQKSTKKAREKMVKTSRKNNRKK